MSIVRQYVKRDLLFLPISARQFGRYLKAAVTTLNELFFSEVLGDYCPCFTDVMLKEQASDLIKQKELTRRQVLVDGLFDDRAVAASLPAVLKTLTNFDPIQFVPSIEQSDGLSDAAVAEHRLVLACCVRAIDRFLEPNCTGVKFPCLVGRPGSGKSHVLKIATAYCLCKGLSVELMSWTSKRARKLGGNHLHLVFPLIVKNNRTCYSQDLVTGCMKRLKQDPLKKNNVNENGCICV